LKPLVLYLRAHIVSIAAAAIIVIGGILYAVASLMVRSDSFGDQALIPTVVIGPIALAIAVTSTVDDPSDEILRSAPFRIGRARVGHVLVLVFLAALVLLPLSTFPGMVLSAPAGIRNLVGYAGLGLVTSWFTTGRWAWVAPVVYGLGALTVEGAARSGHLFFWPTRPDSSAIAWVIAVVLFGLGLVACAVRRPVRFENDTSD
jgi:hypothetical protein